MRPRQLIALASLVSAFVATYLHLWKLGKVGALACTANRGCEIAQFSAYGWFLGVDTALIGAVGHGLIVAVALLGSLRATADRPWPAAVLTTLVTGGLLFTIRLKYGEWWVLRTFCPWCQVNTAVIVLNAALLAAEWRRLRLLRGAAPAGTAATGR